MKEMATGASIGPVCQHNRGWASEAKMGQAAKRVDGVLDRLPFLQRRTTQGEACSVLPGSRWWVHCKGIARSNFMSLQVSCRTMAVAKAWLRER